MSDVWWETELSQFEGRVGILVDRTMIYRVRVFDLTLNNDAVRFRYEKVETPGLNAASMSEHQELGCKVSGLVDRLCWFGEYSGWRLYFSPDVLERVLVIVSALAPGKTYLDDYTPRMAPPGSRFEVIRSPGPVLQALSALFRNLGERR